LWNRVWRGHVDRPSEIVPVDQPFDGLTKIYFVNPRNELAPAGNPASESPLCKPTQDPVNPALTRGEDHPCAQRDLPCSRGGRFEEGFFPSACDLDGELVLGLRGRADYAGGLVHWLIEGVFVDGGCAGVEPDRRRFVAASYCLAKHACRIDSRLQNLSPIARVVPAIH